VKEEPNGDHQPESWSSRVVRFITGKPLDETPEERELRKQHNRYRRTCIYGGLFLVFWGFVQWQPWEYDLLRRKPPSPHPMIDPETDRLFAPGTRVVVISAHPDDTEFYIAGTLLKLKEAGAELYQIVVTDGDKGYYFWEDAERNSRIRRAEQIEASTAWGAREVVFMKYPDGRLRVTEKLVERLTEQLNRLKPDYVLSFDGDYPPRMSHQDHRRTGDATDLAIKNVPSAKWLLRYSTSAPNYVVDMWEYWERKKELLAVHKSQFFVERLARVTNLVASRGESDGELIEANMGEGFRCTKLR
jgi:N,N'-diacetylchitobiose non-reducing end deacetylase